MIPVYAIKCAGCGKRWVAIFDEGCRAEENGTQPFGVECPACGQPQGCAVSGPAHFDTADEARAYYTKSDDVGARVLPFKSQTEA